jgi:acetyl esterase/lipase
LVRSKATELGIDPQRIGMIGFSAGGGVAGHALLNSDKRNYEAVDDIDKTSCRLDESARSLDEFSEAPRAKENELTPEAMGLTIRENHRRKPERQISRG